MTGARGHFMPLGWNLRLLDIDGRGDAVIVAADLSKWDHTWARQRLIGIARIGLRSRIAGAVNTTP